jgi:hypothetical protein
MTVGKAGPRRSVSTGCGASIAKANSPKKPAARTAVSTGCGSTGGGWKAKTVTTGTKGKTSGLSERTSKQLDKAKTKETGRKTVSTGCHAGNKPAKPATHPRVRTGC